MNVLVSLVCGLLIWNGLLTYIMLNHLRNHKVFSAMLKEWYSLPTSTKPITQATGKWEPEYEGE